MQAVATSAEAWEVLTDFGGFPDWAGGGQKRL